jgi:hypothetical protein
MAWAAGRGLPLNPAGPTARKSPRGAGAVRLCYPELHAPEPRSGA